MNRRNSKDFTVCISIMPTSDSGYDNLEKLSKVKISNKNFIKCAKRSFGSPSIKSYSYD